MEKNKEMKTPVILFRASLTEESEVLSAKKFFPVYENRTKIPPNSLVIGRYSCLPFYKELEEDLEINGSCLINSHAQHIWIADLKEWYQDFEDITPKTYFELRYLPENGPFVLKGQTNSKKYNWSTHMYAKDKRQAIEVHGRLSQDSLIGQQDIYIREYVPLRKLADGLNGLQISEEYRFFILDGQVLSGGFYWSSHLDDLTTIPDPAIVPQEFMRKVLKRIGSNARFVVVDIARKEDGDWTVIELNDGGMSGLSENSPDNIYSNMKKVLSFSHSSE